MANKKDSRDDQDRVTPQKVFDQDETEQVGGTVINRNLNRDENKTETPKDQEKHNLNEMDDNDEKAAKKAEKDN